MELDLETFLTALYVMVDEIYQRHIRPQMPRCGGPPALMSDSEVLCLGLAAQWRSGVPWKSERGILRYVRKHLRPLFPTLLTQSAFNRRLRHLWGAFILIQDAVAEALTDAGDYDVMDGFPIPVAHGARSFNPGWLVPEEAYPLLIDLETARSLPRHVQQMTGFRTFYNRAQNGGYLWTADYTELADWLKLDS